MLTKACPAALMQRLLGGCGWCAAVWEAMELSTNMSCILLCAALRCLSKGLFGVFGQHTTGQCLHAAVALPASSCQHLQASSLTGPCPRYCKFVCRFRGEAATHACLHQARRSRTWNRLALACIPFASAGPMSLMSFLKGLSVSQLTPGSCLKAVLHALRRPATQGAGDTAVWQMLLGIIVVCQSALYAHADDNECQGLLAVSECCGSVYGFGAPV